MNINQWKFQQIVLGKKLLNFNKEEKMMNGSIKKLGVLISLSVSLLLGSKKASAIILLPFSNAPECQYSERSHLGLTPSLITDIFISSKIKVITSYLETQRDSISFNREPLCYGAFQEARGINAYSGHMNNHHFIIFGNNLMQKLVNNKHFQVEFDYVLTHEFSHYLQNQLRLDFDHPLPLFASKLKELHADCMTGYLMTMTKMIEGQNKSQLSDLFQLIGDRHAIGDHGEKHVRESAFQFGINKALSYSFIQNYAHNSAQIAQSCSEFIN
jgi:hypothetical protein